MRTMAEPYAPGLVRTLILAIFSMGIIPLILLPSKLREFAARERDQFFHLAQWMRSQFGSDADSLDPRTPGLDRAVHLLRLVSWTGAIVAMGSIAWYLSNVPDVQSLLDATYGFFHTPWHNYGELDEHLFAIWMPSLCIGYAAQWAAVQVHQARVRQFLSSFNSLAVKHGLKEIVPPPEVLGLRPMWLAGAFGFMCFGVLWGIPLMLAGGAQTRYIRHRSRGIRQELSERVGDVLRQTRPAMMLTVPVALRRKCPVAVCQAPLPQAATFCPRCGTRVAAVDRVA